MTQSNNIGDSMLKNIKMFLQIMNGDYEAYLSAACRGDFLTTAALLKKGIQVDARDLNGRTGLMLAASRGHTPVVEQLLHHHANINLNDEKHNAALHYAAKGNNLYALKLIFNQTKNIESKNKKGETPLMIACKKNNSKIMEFLLDNGADINTVNNNGDTLLTLAAQKPCASSINILLQYGINTEIRNREGSTALDIVSQNRGEIDRMLIRVLKSPQDYRDDKKCNIINKKQLNDTQETKMLNSTNTTNELKSDSGKIHTIEDIKIKFKPSAPLLTAEEVESNSEWLLTNGMPPLPEMDTLTMLTCSISCILHSINTYDENNYIENKIDKSVLLNLKNQFELLADLSQKNSHRADYVQDLFEICNGIFKDVLCQQILSTVHGVNENFKYLDIGCAPIELVTLPVLEVSQSNKGELSNSNDNIVNSNANLLSLSSIFSDSTLLSSPYSDKELVDTINDEKRLTEMVKKSGEENNKTTKQLNESIAKTKSENSIEHKKRILLKN